MGRRVALGILLSFALVGPAAAEDTELARRHFETGRAYFDRGDYGKALSEFKAAKEISGRPELDFNIASSYERMGDAAHAVRYYQAYLTARPNADDAAETNEALERLRRRVGTLRIVSRVPGAHLTVDGEPVETLGAPVSLTEGPHVVNAALEGYRSATATAQVTAGTEATVTVDPQPVTAPLLPPVEKPATRRRWPLWLGIGLGAAALVGVAVAVGVTQAPSGTDQWAAAKRSCTGSCEVVDLR
jgi:tetratricopeptide (TPR) repeat protein